MNVRESEDVIFSVEPSCRLYAVTQSMAGQRMPMDHLIEVDPSTAAFLAEELPARIGYVPDFIEFAEASA